MQQSDTGYHYQMMQRAIDIIDQHDGAITLENLAREMGMSLSLIHISEPTRPY